MTLAANLAALARRLVGTSANNLVALDSAAKLPAVDGSQLANINRGWDFVAEHRETSGLSGGNAPATSWATRTLNTVVQNKIGASLASNKVTLPAGTYEVEWDTPAYGTNSHQSRLYNDTAGSVIAYGTSGTAAAGYNHAVVSVGRTQVTLAASTALRLDTYTQTAATAGFGYPGGSGGYEVYERFRARILS